MERIRSATQGAVKLFLDGCAALAGVEASGMRVDTTYLDSAVVKVGERIAYLQHCLEQDEVCRVWKKAYGRRMNVGSRAQLGDVLFKRMGVPSKSLTRGGGRPSTDEATLKSLDIPFVNKYLEIEQLKKLRGTYLEGVRREVVDGFLHPVFNLHLVTTFRSSSSDPNFQNIPARDPKISKLIRRAFIPRNGHVLVEVDYKAIEVRVAACYHKDPVMVEYIENNFDLHSEMAGQCYMLEDPVTKQARFAAKGGFVFAEFYGDFYPHVAANLWNAIESDRLTTAGGMGLYEHLAGCGISSLGACDPKRSPVRGTFESHIKEVEEDFWGRRFKKYGAWKSWWWERYQERGWYRLLTGFIIQGIYKRNEVINGPIQGSAFHCLLWSLVQLSKWLRRNRMRSVIVGQIHDSLVLDVHKDELQDVLAEATKIMTLDIVKEWRWLIVPLEIEVEMAETNWFEKRSVKV